jgi:hypothetical protein
MSVQYVNIEIMRLFVLWLELEKDVKELTIAEEKELLAKKVADARGVEDIKLYLSGRNFNSERQSLEDRDEELTWRASRLDQSALIDHILTPKWWRKMLQSTGLFLERGGSEIVDFKDVKRFSQRKRSL